VGRKNGSRLASKCSNFHPWGVRFALATHRIVSFRRRAILRRFVPLPRKMANTRRLVLAKASHTHTNRRGRLVPPTAGSAPWVQFPQTRRAARPFQAPRKNSVGSSRPRSPAFAGLVLAGRKGRASHRHRSGLKIPPRPLSAPVTPLASMARQPHKRARRAALINAVSPHQFPPFGIPPS
jgi:hypothetical protein